MNVEIAKAVSLLYGTSSFEDIYCEAVANAIDANATAININILLDTFRDTKSLKLEISDNGDGFTDKNFHKFSTLLEVEGNHHKGVGRLVYLAYFNDINIESTYEHTKHRAFIFNRNFKSENTPQPKIVGESNNRTTLTFRNFVKKKLRARENVQAFAVKEMLSNRFLPWFYALRKNGKTLTITIRTEVSNPKEETAVQSETVYLSLDELPAFKSKPVDIQNFDMFNGVTLMYAIKEGTGRKGSFACSICIDGRAMDYSISNYERIPQGYSAKFIIQSDALSCKADAARQKIEFPTDFQEDVFKRVLRKEISNILKEHIPGINESNRKAYNSFEKTYPHLYGLYDEADAVGLITSKQMLEAANEKLFKKQKQILGGRSMSERAYNDAMQLASRSLTEYILYRSYIIERLKNINKNGSETDIHNIISPRYSIYSDKTADRDIYSNNVWLLDDKFMSYDTVMSDKQMADLLGTIDESYEKEGTPEEIERPDISIVFSADPSTAEKVDVVIVELKKYGINHYEQNKIVEQLKERARNLVDHYENGKINQMWFFGVLELTQKFKHAAREAGYKSVFSRGEVFYNREKIISYKTDIEYNIDVFLMNYETFIKDAEARNSTFLNILKKRIMEFSQNKKSS